MERLLPLAAGFRPASAKATPAEALLEKLPQSGARQRRLADVIGDRRAAAPAARREWAATTCRPMLPISSLDSSPHVTRTGGLLGLRRLAAELS